MADDQIKPKLVEQFTNITGVSEERAKFFLESAAWDCDTAIANFYEDGAEEVLSSDEEEVKPLPPSSNQPQLTLPPSSQQISFTADKKKQTSSSNSKISTLNSLRQNESDSSEEEGQAFYAGGSESGGGQQILGPKKKKDTNSLVMDMFKMAKEHGAEIVDNTQSQPMSAKKPAYFQGPAYRLGGQDDANQPSTSYNTRSTSGSVRPQQVDVVLKFWQNGFSIDNGPLREFTDPNNVEFLNDIRSGKVPKELIALAKGDRVNLNMEDHSHEDYVKPKVTMQAFTGHGYRLGNPTDEVTVTPKVSSQDSSVDGSSSKDLNKKAVESNIKLDPTLPTTNIQIRLPDGSKLVSKFNYTHTIADVRNYVMSSNPAVMSREFILMTTFPNKELTDDTATISSANLINSVLVVKYK